MSDGKTLSLISVHGQGALESYVKYFEYSFYEKKSSSIRVLFDYELVKNVNHFV